MPEHRLLSLSHSEQSLYHFVCIPTSFLSSFPSLLFFFVTLLLPPLVRLFLSALPPFRPAHMAAHTHPSIGCTVDKSKGLAGTCHPQHHPACLHQTTPYFCYTQSVVGRKTIFSVWVNTPQILCLWIQECMVAKQKTKQDGLLFY